MKQSEKILLTIFILAIFGLGTGIGFDLYRKSKAELTERKWALELQLAEYEVLIEEEALWKSRGKWLNTTQPPYTSRDAIDNHIFKTVKTPPGKITVSNIKLIEAKQDDHWIQAGARVVAQGTLKEVFGWLYSLQSPDNFFVINHLKVIPEKKTLDIIRCEFELVRWYAPQS